jgi:hypothetical protein
MLWATMWAWLLPHGLLLLLLLLLRIRLSIHGLARRSRWQGCEIPRRTGCCPWWRRRPV